jgi:hypothetical protein
MTLLRDKVGVLLDAAVLDPPPPDLETMLGHR